jgi:hypothetical protein
MVFAVELNSLIPIVLDSLVHLFIWFSARILSVTSKMALSFTVVVCLFDVGVSVEKD